MSESIDDSQSCLKTLQIQDRHYSLCSYPCKKCGEPVLSITRIAGASVARYFLPHNADEDDFEFFAQSMDETLLNQSSDLLRDFHSKLQEVNSELGMHIDGSFASRLLEYGRQRVLKLQRLGLFDALLATGAPKNRPQEAVRTAFELGMAAAEHRLIDTYEDYLLDGMAMADWREEGLPAARAERLRQGQRSRTAILKAAKSLYEKDPTLIRNDARTARAIQRLEFPELEKGYGHQLGIDAITKHLREARKCHHGTKDRKS
jgi:hypothetical protein